MGDVHRIKSITNLNHKINKWCLPLTTEWYKRSHSKMVRQRGTNGAYISGGLKPVEVSSTTQLSSASQSLIIAAHSATVWWEILLVTRSAFFDATITRYSTKYIYLNATGNSPQQKHNFLLFVKNHSEQLLKEFFWPSWWHLCLWSVFLLPWSYGCLPQREFRKHRETNWNGCFCSFWTFHRFCW